MRTIPIIVRDAKKKLNNRSVDKYKVHDIVLSELDENDGKVFSAIWFRIIDVYECYMDYEFRDWNRAKEIHHKNLTELQPKLNNQFYQEIDIFESYMNSMELMMKKYNREWMKMKWKYSNRVRVNKRETIMAEELKQIYFKSMSSESGDIINDISDMSDIYIGDTTAIEFYENIVEPICNILPSMSASFNSKIKFPEGSEKPNLTSLQSLFEQSLRVNRDATSKTLQDKNPKLVYDSLIANGVWKGSYNEFKEFHPTQQQRKDSIVHNIIHTIECALKLRGKITKGKITKFEKFLLSKKKDRYSIA